MNAQDHLRQALDHERTRLCSTVPRDQRAAIVALVNALAQLQPDSDASPDLIAGRRIANLGGNRAVHLCLDASQGGSGAPSASGADVDAWAATFLEACTHLVEAETVLAHCESGFMRLALTEHGTLHAWIASKRPPANWRERADYDWWANLLARQHAPDPSVQCADPANAATYQRLASVYVDRMGHQSAYPPEASFGGITMRTFRTVLTGLIARGLRSQGLAGEGRPVPQQVLATDIARSVNVKPAVAEQVIGAFTLDRENAAYHAAVPGIAAAPLVRVGPAEVVLSPWGLTTDPLLFLMRELRRRDPEAYNNSAHLRETVFRQDLYAYFQDRRFVTSAGRLELRRESGNVRTDIDAVIFDRKSGTLAVFELKSQDPFARSTAELARQRDNVLYANRQISGVLAWLQRYGAQELLTRVDSRTAKTFRAQKVYPFVLGRYIAHFNDGPEPDRRAAWGTWPQLLRLLDSQPIRPADANPFASIFSRLTKDTASPAAHIDAPPRELDLGTTRLVVHASYEEVQTRVGLGC
jgi:hypothetical protein